MYIRIYPNKFNENHLFIKYLGSRPLTALQSTRILTFEKCEDILSSIRDQKSWIIDSKSNLRVFSNDIGRQINSLGRSFYSFIEKSQKFKFDKIQLDRFEKSTRRYLNEWTSNLSNRQQNLDLNESQFQFKLKKSNEFADSLSKREAILEKRELNLKSDQDKWIKKKTENEMNGYLKVNEKKLI